MNGGGEIRGQIIRSTEQLFIARLDGLQQTPPNTNTSTGAAGVIVTTATGAAKYQARWDGADFVTTMAHIHQGGPGASGPVVLGFVTDGGTSVAGSGTITGWPADGGYYVNVHSEDAGNGIIRGALIKQ